jgi:hypothetical protein
MAENKIFTDDYMKVLKTEQYTGAAVTSLKKIVLLLAFRCQELEDDFRKLESAFEELKNHSSTLE